MQQASSTPPPPTPPPAPAVPQAPAVTAQATTTSPTTEQWATLRARQSELSRQLSSAESRRESLSRSLHRAEGSDRAGIEQRITVLDKRILQIETDMAETGRQLAATAPPVTATTTQPPRFSNGPRSQDVAMVATVFTMFVLAPLAIAFARLLWKRATGSAAAPRVAPELAQRLEHLEQAVDTIAIEMERVSEGQRFMTRVLTEGNGFAALGAGQRAAEPVRMGEEAAIPMPRKRS